MRSFSKDHLVEMSIVKIIVKCLVEKMDNKQVKNKMIEMADITLYSQKSMFQNIINYINATPFLLLANI